MSDFFRECNTGDLKIDPKTFKSTWCAHCHRPDCDLAVLAKLDPMAQRNATWRERFFGAEQADLSAPRYAQIAELDFPSLLQKAMKLEISAKRGDWSVPEIPVLDGRIVVAPSTTTSHVDEAVKRLTHRAALDLGPEDEDMGPEDEEEDEDMDPEEDEELLIEEPEAPLPPVRRPPAPPPSRHNTPDLGEVMVGGAKAPAAVNRGRPVPEDDPWAPPPKASVTVVKSGARIQFGADGKARVTSGG